MASASSFEAHLPITPLIPYAPQNLLDLAYLCRDTLKKMSEKITAMENIPLDPPQSRYYSEKMFSVMDDINASEKEYTTSYFPQKIRDQFFKTYPAVTTTTHQIGLQFLLFSQSFLHARINELGNIIFQRDFLITDNEIKLTPIYPFMKDKTTCGQYVLYMLNLKADSKDPFKQHCQPVLDPEPGDVAIYGNVVSKKFSSKHFGIYFSSECVYSKWGDYPEIIQHPLNATLSIYGDAVRFVRRKVKYDCQRELSEKIVAILDDANTFSPYSNRGFINFFIDYFREVSQRDIATSLPNSMLGTKAIKKYRALVMAELRKMEYLCESRLEFLNHMKVEVHRIAASQKIKMPKPQN